MSLSKDDMILGGLYWLRLLPGDSKSRCVTPELTAAYTAKGLERGFCDHPCAVVDLQDGSNSDELKVFVCNMTSFDGKDLNEHIRNPDIRQKYLSIFPKRPTDEHPGVQLELINNLRMKKGGYVYREPRSVPIELLEVYTASRRDTNHYQLDERSLNILRRESGFPPLSSNAGPDLRSAPGAGALRQAPVLTKVARSTHGTSEQSRGRDAAEHTTEKGGEVKCCTNFVQVLRMICGTSVPWDEPETSLPSILFSTLERQAPNSSVLCPLIPFVIVDMKLYQATTNMPCRFIPSSQTRETRRIEITKTRTILSIGVLVNGHSVSKREQVHGNNEANRNGARGILGRLLLCESREGLNLELLDIHMTEQSWKELAQNWGPPDASWEGPP